MSQWPKAILLASIAALLPIQAVLNTVALLIVGDFIFGVIAAKKRGEVISSSGMRRSISKLLIYEVVVILGFLFEHYLAGDSIPVAKVIAAAIGVVELKSILENSDSIFGQSIFKALVSKLGSSNEVK